MAFLEISRLEKKFGAVDVLKGIDLDVEEGGFLVLVGPSGCGKSTLLSTIAGLESITAGEIRIAGKNVAGLHPSERDIAMVFQSYALYPNMTVAGNIGFGMEIRGVPKPERDAAIRDVSDMLQIGHLLDRKPSQLSGGQRQRVAMGRALVRRPQVFLFDEPLSNLDAKLRVDMRTEIKRLHQRLKTTIVYVTHDQIEAMTLATKIAVLKDGILQQSGTPAEIYNRPATKFVANFVGTLNTLEGEVLDAASGRVKIEGNEVTLGRTVPAGKITLAARPEMISLGDHPGRETRMKGTINDVHFLGSVIRIRAQVGESVLAFDTFNASDSPPPKVGEMVTLSLAARDLLVVGA